jgi:hypothetical protein
VKLVEFTPPPGVVPEDAAPGKEFDLVCSFRVKESGQVCLVMMGDAKMPGYESREDKPAKRDYSEEYQAMQKMTQSPSGQDMSSGY